MSHTFRPTILIYGCPHNPAIVSDLSQNGSWGLVVDNGLARDPIFTIYENLARADAIIALPNAHPVHLVTLIAEGEVGHPLITQSQGGSKEFQIKPIVFLGSKEEWAALMHVCRPMQDQGLLRGPFGRIVHFAATVTEAIERVAQYLPARAPSTRLHYYTHALKAPDMEERVRNPARVTSEITIACFGSASTTNPTHLARADRLARLLAQYRYGILHGGGLYGVMGQLSASAAIHEAHVTGITVHLSGAPKIFFERQAGDGASMEVDREIASKDMLHRIESYAGNSLGFVALDGGIGTLQEILVIAELLYENHPVVCFENIHQEFIKKPLWVLNEGQLYSALLHYLERGNYGHLRENIQVAASVEQFGKALSDFFDSNPPRAAERAGSGTFRERYAEQALRTSPGARGPGISPRDS